MDTLSHDFRKKEEVFVSADDVFSNKEDI